MATTYWDSEATSSWDSEATSSYKTYWYSLCDSCTSNTMWYAYHLPRRILVHPPEHWADDDVMAFVKLVNVKTRTGWLVTMVIKGDVIITDPNIEARTMEEFVPLLRLRASREDSAKISMFFEKHPLTI